MAETLLNSSPIIDPSTNLIQKLSTAKVESTVSTAFWTVLIVNSWAVCQKLSHEGPPFTPVVLWDGGTEFQEDLGEGGDGGELRVSIGRSSLSRAREERFGTLVFGWWVCWTWTFAKRRRELFVSFGRDLKLLCKATILKKKCNLFIKCLYHL
jgi:hypothetical protein